MTKLKHLLIKSWVAVFPLQHSGIGMPGLLNTSSTVFVQCVRFANILIAMVFSCFTGKSCLVLQNFSKVTELIPHGVKVLSL